MITKLCLPPLKAEGLSWADVKRTVVRAPQMVRSRVNVGVHTTDSDFDFRHEQFLTFERRLLSMERSATVYSDSATGLLRNSTAIGNTFKTIFGGHFGRMLSEAYPVSPELAPLFAAADKYIDDTSHMEPKVVAELEEWVTRIRATILKASHLVRAIKKQITARNTILLDVDRYANYVEGAKRRELLTAKQHQLMITNERRLDSAREKYETLNLRLKKELPVFLELGRQLIQPLFVMSYFLQLTVAYQLNTTLQLLVGTLAVDMTALLNDEGYERLVAHHERLYAGANDIIKNLAIVNFHETFLHDLARTPLRLAPVDRSVPPGSVPEPVVPPDEYCIAVYSFRAVEPTDLSLKVGDVIKVLDRSGPWWIGECAGALGTFPGNYIKQM